MESIKIMFIDIPGAIAVVESLEPSTSFHDFTALLSRMSGSVSEQIEDLDRSQPEKRGFNLSDGCWWYRVVKTASTNDLVADSAPTQATKGDWSRLANLTAYNKMREELAGDTTMGGGWIEVEHNLQKKRDELQAAEAQEKDKNWRSSISQAEEGLQDSKDAEGESVGSCTPTAQVKYIIDEYQAHLHPLVIGWPEAPRCTLIHLNESQVSQDAHSRNHDPVPFHNFAKGKEQHHAEETGLPSYTPRPGPFPAQIGTPPSVGYCAYEIHNDVDHVAESPKLEDARVQPPAAVSQTSASHYARYGNSHSEDDRKQGTQASGANMVSLLTSMSLPVKSPGYVYGGSFYDPQAYPVQSAPAHVQNFPQSTWEGKTIFNSDEQHNQRSSRQETYLPPTFDNTSPYQGMGYFGSGYSYQSQPIGRSSSDLTNPYQSSRTPSSQSSLHAAVRNPSCPPPPQDVVLKSFQSRKSDYSFGGSNESDLSQDSYQVNTDAMKESEIIGMRAQSQEYNASSCGHPRLSCQPTPTHYSRSSSTSQPRFGYPPSRTSSQQSNRTLLPGFSPSAYGTEAPTFATADTFTQSFEMVTQGLDPALEKNHQLSMGQDAHQKMTWKPSPGQFPQFFGPPNGRGTPTPGQFSPPKPRRKGQSVANLLNRYNRVGFMQQNARGGNSNAHFGFIMRGTGRVPEQKKGTGRRKNGGGFAEAPSMLLETPSLLDQVSKELSREYDVAPPQHQANGYADRPDHNDPGRLGEHVRADSKSSDHLHDRNPTTQLSDYIKPDNPHRPSGASKATSSDPPSSSPSRSSTPSNFSDDFMINGNGEVRKKRAKRPYTKRGAVKESDAVKKESNEEYAMQEKDLVKARAARANRRSSGRFVDGKENEDGSNEKKNDIEQEEGNVMMTEG